MIARRHRSPRYRNQSNLILVHSPDADQHGPDPVSSPVTGPHGPQSPALVESTPLLSPPSTSGPPAALQQVPIPLLVGAFPRHDPSPSKSPKRNPKHFAKINFTAIPKPSQPKLLKCGLFNAHSLGDAEHADALKDLVVQHDLDCMAYTETWLRGDDSDAQKEGEITPSGYRFSSRPRRGRRGGGVGVLTRANIAVKTFPPAPFTSFEHQDVQLSIAKTHLRLIIIYRPPPSTKNKLTPALFLEQFLVLLEQICAIPGNMIIVGDFNIHVDSPNSPNDTLPKRFLGILESMGLTQHVSGPTHRAGHTLDLIITRSESCLIRDVVVLNPGLSDHSAVFFTIALPRPQPLRITKPGRKLRAIDHNVFNTDLSKTTLLTAPPSTIEGLVNVYNSCLSSTLDHHAPIKSRTYIEKPDSKWWSDELTKSRCALRYHERTKTRTGLEVHNQIYKDACKEHRSLRYQTKRSYYIKCITEAAGDQGALFKLTDKLLRKSSDMPLPAYESPATLAGEFTSFYNEKVRKIQAGLRPPRFPLNLSLSLSLPPPPPSTGSAASH